LSIAELAGHLPPTHDLESLTVWLTMAREAGIVFRDGAEAVEVVCSDGPRLRFQVPLVWLSADTVPDREWEI
jgi:hypothetical protein